MARRDEAPTSLVFDPERVHVLRSSDPDARRRWLASALGALLPIKSREVIAVKPNLGSPLPDATGATTALWLIEAVLEFVLSRRARPILVEGPSHIHDHARVMEITGAGALCRSLGVEVVDARDGAMPLRPGKHDAALGRVLHVHPAVLSADGIVCLPKLKTHNRTGVSLGLKGLMGLLAVPDRHGFHRRGVEEDVVALYGRLAGRIRATFVDGVIAMEGQGPTNGRAVRMDVVIAGRDAVAVDATSAMIMGFDPEDIHHIRMAHEQRLGDIDRPVTVHPAGSPLPVRPFERARSSAGLWTQLITFPPVSRVLRAGHIGTVGRTKPVVRAEARGRRFEAAAAACPTGAIDAELRIDYARCVGCALCIAACPDALEPEGRRRKLGRAARELLTPR